MMQSGVTKWATRSCLLPMYAPPPNPIEEDFVRAWVGIALLPQHRERCEGIFHEVPDLSLLFLFDSQQEMVDVSVRTTMGM